MDFSTTGPKSFPLKEAFIFAKDNNLENQAEKIKNLNIEPSRNKRNLSILIRKGYFVRLFEDNGIYSKFISQFWQYGSTKDGENRRKRYLQFSSEYDLYLAEITGEDEQDIDDSEAITSYEFALESHLRDFLAKNLDQLEPGLILYQENGKTGIEFAIDEGRGRIDILAVDSSNKLVVIELKLSRGRNKVIGQLLYYMGWVDKNLNKGQCRGIIVASDIGDDLAVAVSRTSCVTLYRYKMNFSMEKIRKY